MKASIARPSGCAWQWNPPARRAQRAPHAAGDVQSANECTGLVAHPPQDEEEAQALSALCAIHAVKPQGNIGKDNPNNPPHERAFHRG